MVVIKEYENGSFRCSSEIFKNEKEARFWFDVMCKHEPHLSLVLAKVSYDDKGNLFEDILSEKGSE